MAAASGVRISPVLFGGGFLAVAALVMILSASVLAGSLSAGLLMQLAFGGEMPSRALAASICFFVGCCFTVLGVVYLLGFLH